MAELGYVSLDIQYVDGTKIESASNKYTFVWKGTIEKNKAKLEDKIHNIIKEIDSSIKEDERLEKQEYRAFCKIQLLSQRTKKGF